MYLLIACKEIKTIRREEIFFTFSCFFKIIPLKLWRYLKMFVLNITGKLLKIS